ncbi:MAG: NADH-quinone oxidoreductase subunit NuoF [Oscillospiraceae bacterium]|nr:NADH-quinone oxidoreductase subunit NuoF [Oscillospiraceae bacterium]
MANYRYNVVICGDTGCRSAGSEGIASTLKDALEREGIAKDVNIVVAGCFGICSLAPIAIVYPEGAFYVLLKAEDTERIVKEHLVGGNVVKELLYNETVKGDDILPFNQTKFYKKQKRIALQNCGVIYPYNIKEYIAVDGYQALGRSLAMSPDDVLKIIDDSGIRGRGGAGFPTGRKWSFAKMTESEKKYVVCNADEGDPGAFMDRAILEGDPHSVLEAMAIAGYIIGADQGYIYVRAEYPISIKCLNHAIKEANTMGLLGNNIMGTGFNFNIELRLGAGAFVCGEETALLTSIEGNRGEPRPRPPFPAVKGLFEKPTIINNVETWANIPKIINNGAEWFSSIGTEKSKGTKVFALGGKVNNTGLVEVPMGTTLREIVEEIGGGVPNHKKFKAAQTGGPSGGCIPDSNYDVRIDYDNLLEIGSMMGSGGMIIMDEDNCMVDMARFFLDFTVEESCGKCSPCRIGTHRLLEILDKIIEGNGTLEDLDKMEQLCHHIKESSLCALGNSAPNPVLSMMKYFRDEYVEHVTDKKCRAGVCKSMLSYEIIAEKCIGCTLCKKACPVGCIIGNVKEPHVIDKEKCIKCGVCVEKCKFGAIIRR